MFRPIVIVLAGIFAGLAGCKSQDPDKCWNTSIIRLQVASAVYDVPAEMKPVPDPSDGDGVLTPDYPVDQTGKARLMWCQARSHVPLRVRSFSIEPVHGKGLKIRLSEPDAGRSLPDATRALDWKLVLTERRNNMSTYLVADGAGRTARVWCQLIRPVNKAEPTALCRTEASLAGAAKMSLAFNGNGLLPSQYLEVIQSSALEAHGMRHRPARSAVR